MELDNRTSEIVDREVYGEGNRRRTATAIVEWAIRAERSDDGGVRIVGRNEMRLPSGSLIRLNVPPSFLPATMRFNRTRGGVEGFILPEGGQNVLQVLTIRTGDHVETAITDGTQWAARIEGLPPTRVVRLVDLIEAAILRAAELGLPAPTFELNDAKTKFDGFKPNDLLAAIDSWEKAGREIRTSRRISSGKRYAHPWRRPVVKGGRRPVVRAETTSAPEFDL
jgi:hypothetical protein